MASLPEIRAQYPQYNDMSDADLAGALHQKFYSDMPFDDFSARVGLVQSQPEPQADIGRMKAIEVGLKQGATGNFYDELSGLSEAGKVGGFNIPNIPVPGLAGLQQSIGAGRMLAETLAGAPGDATAAYEAARDQFRGDAKTAQQQYPGTTLAGNIGGAVMLPGGAMLQAATMPARMARGAMAGSLYGGVSGAGEGETAEERLSKGTSGGLVGAGVGAVAPPLVSGLAGGLGALVRPVTSTIRGAVNPEAEAARRVTSAITRDLGAEPGAAARQAQIGAAGRAGAPTANVDLGGETTRALARSAANTSPEARASLQALADTRFEGQSDRASTFIRRLVGGTDSQATREALETQARAVNNPAYQRAYRAPSAQSLWDEGFEQISQAPEVQAAIRKVLPQAASQAARQGFTPIRNPFVLDPASGRMVLRAQPDGSMARPNLEFWDRVKRELDRGDFASRDWSRVLRSRLDELIPDYQVARQGAARFFGAENALEAGENYVRSPMSAREGARLVAQFTPQERELFRQGFASRLIDDINNTRDRVNVLNRIGQSPEARNKLRIVLGNDGYRRIESFLTVEQVMDRVRQAVTGNSTTARQLVELGLAGGTLGYGQLTGDPGALTNAAVVYGLLRGQRAVDQRVARRVADMLTSNDPNVLSRGVQLVARNQNLRNAFIAIDAQLARIGGQQGTGVPALQSMGVGRAEDDQPNIPRP